jgi:hypothetical protein
MLFVANVIRDAKLKSASVIMKKKSKDQKSEKEDFMTKKDLKDSKHQGMLNTMDEVCEKLNQAGYGPFAWEIVIKRNVKYDI